MKLKPDQEQLARTILKGLELFSGWTDEQIQAVVPLLDSRQTAKGKVVLMDQEIARTLFILVTGSVGIYKRVGGERKQLAVLKAPNFCGERAMFEEAAASAFVKTEEESLIYALERAQWDQIALKFPGLDAVVKKNMEAVREKRIGPVVPPHEGES
jgi:signal-transduction protein with cAMP-binding, CBS, and nucleotidyltransferase domain